MFQKQINMLDDPDNTFSKQSRTNKNPDNITLRNQIKKRYKQHMKLKNKEETDMNIIRISWNRQQKNDINSMRCQQIDINSIIIYLMGFARCRQPPPTY